MKILFLHSIVVVQCVALRDLLTSPNFPISKFCCCQEIASVNFSMKINSRFGQFGSIANRGVLVELISTGFVFYEWHCCVDTVLSDECNMINHPCRTKLIESLLLTLSRSDYFRLRGKLTKSITL